MNYKKLGKILGKILFFEGLLMLAPLCVALIYREPLINVFAFIVPIAALMLTGSLLQLPRATRNTFTQREGFALVSLGWILMTLFGAIPFVINGDIPNYIDACFEIMSGFTTTGASIVEDITLLSHSTLFWRSFSHWIGGMGILVFVLIFIPESNEGSSMHLLRAESPGPQVGKLSSKMKVTARVLYLIYLGLTVAEIILLVLDKPIPGYESDHVFNSFLASFGCAGTGGFGFIPGSMELYSPYSQYVMATFLLLYGTNFSLFYLMLLGRFKRVFRSEELRTYLTIAVTGVACVFTTLVLHADRIIQGYTVEEAFRHSYFQVASIMTTTGYTTTDYNVWPMTAVTVLIVLMIIGSMAGSTAGGIKVSRFNIALRGSLISIRQMINPRYVPKAKYEGKSLEEKTINGVFAFITIYFLTMFAAVLILSFDPINGQTIAITSDAGSYEVQHGFLSNFSASLACISNIGPGMEGVGPYSSYFGYNAISKIVLTLTMLIGRLEIFPVFIMFNPKTWRKF